jgi:hypothetical protein
MVFLLCTAVQALPSVRAHASPQKHEHSDYCPSERRLQSVQPPKDYFALAQKPAALHIEQAFQASSPKTFQGGLRPAIFFAPLAARKPRSYVPASLPEGNE